MADIQPATNEQISELQRLSDLYHSGTVDQGTHINYVSMARDTVPALIARIRQLEAQPTCDELKEQNQSLLDTTEKEQSLNTELMKANAELLERNEQLKAALISNQADVAVVKQELPKLKDDIADLIGERDAAAKGLRDMTQDRDRWRDQWEMFKNAWIRELGGPFVTKTHLIDALVLTTREMVQKLKVARSDETLKTALEALVDVWTLDYVIAEARPQLRPFKKEIREKWPFLATLLDSVGLMLGAHKLLYENNSSAQPQSTPTETR